MLHYNIYITTNKYHVIFVDELETQILHNYIIKRKKMYCKYIPIQN